MLSASVAGFFLISMNGPSRLMFAIAGLLLVSPNNTGILYSLCFAAPVLTWQIYSRYFLMNIGLAELKIGIADFNFSLFVEKFIRNLKRSLNVSRVRL